MLLLRTKLISMHIHCWQLVLRFYSTLLEIYMLRLLSLLFHLCSQMSSQLVMETRQMEQVMRLMLFILTGQQRQWQTSHSLTRLLSLELTTSWQQERNSSIADRWGTTLPTVGFLQVWWTKHLSSMFITWVRRWFLFLFSARIYRRVCQLFGSMLILLPILQVLISILKWMKSDTLVVMFPSRSRLSMWLLSADSRLSSIMTTMELTLLKLKMVRSRCVLLVVLTVIVLDVILLTPTISWLEVVLNAVQDAPVVMLVIRQLVPHVKLVFTLTQIHHHAELVTWLAWLVEQQLTLAVFATQDGLSMVVSVSHAHQTVSTAPQTLHAQNATEVMAWLQLVFVENVQFIVQNATLTT